MAVRRRICRLVFVGWLGIKHVNLNLLKLQVDHVHLVLHVLELVANLVAQLALLLPTQVHKVLGLIFEQLADGFEVGLPVVDLLFVVLLLADDYELGEVHLVFEVACVEHLLQFTDQHGFLGVIVGYGEVDDLLKRVGNNGNDEVHENHGEGDSGQNVDEEGQVHVKFAVLEANLLATFVHKGFVEPIFLIEQAEVSHGRSQSGQQQRQPWVDSAV